MALGKRLKSLLPTVRLLSVSVCLCAFIAFPATQVSSAIPVAEGECPVEEDGETSEELVDVWSSARRRVNRRNHDDTIRYRQSLGKLDGVNSKVHRHPDIAGHQVTAGHSAPLLI